MCKKQDKIIFLLLAFNRLKLLSPERRLDLIQPYLQRLKLCNQVYRLMGIGHDIFNSVANLIQILCHLRQRHVKKERKQKKKPYNHKKCLVVSNKIPI